MHNRQEIIGFLGADARIADVGEKRIRANFRVATTHRVFKSSGEHVEHTEWFSIKVFANAAAKQVYRDRLVKGALVWVAGRTMTEPYTNDEGEEKEARFVIVDAADLQFLDRREKPEAPPPAATTRSAPASALAAAATPAPAPAPAAHAVASGITAGYSQGTAKAPPGLDRAALMDFGAP